MFFLVEFVNYFKILNIFIIYYCVNEYICICLHKINLIFGTYINLNNFGFENIFHLFNNSVDYNFFVISTYYQLLFNNLFMDITFSAKSFINFNFTNNLYFEDLITNDLLANSLQHIHPLLFFIILNYTILLKYKNFYIIKLIMIFIVLVFTFLGVFWSNQNNFWNSWWVWDISEFFVFIILVFLIKGLHVKQKLSKLGTIFFCILINEAVSFALYDLINNFYNKSHEFIESNYLKNIIYSLTILNLIFGHLYFKKLENRGIIVYKKNYLSFFFSLFALIVVIVKKLYFIIIITYLLFALSVLIKSRFSINYIFFKNKFILFFHIIIILFVLSTLTRWSFNCSLVTLHVPKYFNFILNFESYYVDIINFKFFYLENSKLDILSLIDNFKNNNKVGVPSSFLNVKNLNHSGDNFLFFYCFGFTVICYFLNFFFIV